LKLEVAVTDVSPSRKELTIEVPVEEVGAAYEKAYQEYTRYAKVPGFRQGRVPRSVIRQRFAKDLNGQVISEIVPHALSHAIQDHQIRAIGDPDINPDDLQVSEGNPLRFKVAVEVIPQFELGQYKGLKLTRRIATVTEEDIDRLVDYWRESAAEFVPVEDRPAENGDFVSVNLVGKYVDPVEEEDLKSDDLQIELGGEHVQPEFSTNLTGVKSGDVREFRVVYPDDFSAKGLAGKTLDFTATVVAVRRKELPTIDDESVKQFGPYESAVDMRQKVREMLEKSAAGRADQRLNDELITEIVSTHNFEIPTKLFQKQRESRARQYLQRVFNSGLPPEEIAKIDLKGDFKRIEHAVAREIRSSIIFERIGEVETIKVTEDELRAEISRRAASEGVTEAQLYDRLTKEDALSSIESSLFYEKVMKQVIAAAEVTNLEVTAEEEAEYDQKASLPLGIDSAEEDGTAEQDGSAEEAGENGEADQTAGTQAENPSA
jgi:trigger factor